MLEVTSLSRSYGSFRAVDDVSFTVNQGEIVGLLGHNGAGKTTIMRMLSGFLEPDSGLIRFVGQDPANDPESVQRMLGYLPENPPVYAEMSVVDYLDYAAEMKGIASSGKGSEVRRVVSQTDIGSKLFDPISTLSRGYKQRVGVAQAILGKPRLLIFDEPTNGLDPRQTEQMRQLMVALAQSATVILSTHIMQEVDAVCDRVLILRNGRLITDAKLADLRQSKKLTLCTSWGSEDVCESLSGLEGVESTEVLKSGSPPGDRFHTYSLSISDQAEPREVCAAVARRVHQANENLYSLQHEKRDLETLFHQANESSQSPAKEVSNDL